MKKVFLIILITFLTQCGYTSLYQDIGKININIKVVDMKGDKVSYGQEGRILVTSLFNKAFPVIRYEIGDIGIIQKKYYGKFKKDMNLKFQNVIEDLKIREENLISLSNILFKAEKFYNTLLLYEKID